MVQQALEVPGRAAAVRRSLKCEGCTRQNRVNVPRLLTTERMPWLANPLGCECKSKNH